MTLSLGWLQAFRCAAHHLDYGPAAEELGVTPGQVKQRVLKLEVWLRKVLLLDQPLELSEGDGAAFVAIATDVLNRCEAAWPERGAVLAGSARRRKLISKVRLEDLERLLAVTKAGSYKAAAADLACEISTVQRSVKALELLAGQPLFSGRAMLKLTPAGERIRDAASFVSSTLYSFRGVVPEGYDPERAADERLFRQTKLLEGRLQSVASLIASTGKKQRGKVRLKDVAAGLDVVHALQGRLLEKHGSQLYVSGKDLDLTGIHLKPTPDAAGE